MQQNIWVSGKVNLQLGWSIFEVKSVLWFSSIRTMYLSLLPSRHSLRDFIMVSQKERTCSLLFHYPTLFSSPLSPPDSAYNGDWALLFSSFCIAMEIQNIKSRLRIYHWEGHWFKWDKKLVKAWSNNSTSPEKCAYNWAVYVHRYAFAYKDEFYTVSYYTHCLLNQLEIKNILRKLHLY